MVLKTGCVMVAKICMSQRKIMKSVIALERKNTFHHENSLSKSKVAINKKKLWIYNV